MEPKQKKIMLPFDLRECMQKKTTHNKRKLESVVRYAQEKMMFLYKGGVTKDALDTIIDDVIEHKYWGAPILILSPLSGCTRTQYMQHAYERMRSYVPNNQRWDLFQDYYVQCGFDFPQHLVFEAQYFRPQEYLAELPDEYKDDDVITVYRASTTAPEWCFGQLSNTEIVAQEVSWTIKPSVAMYFCLTRPLIRKEKCYVYQGFISKKDIIAYISLGEQYEVLQYDSVRNLSYINERQFARLCINDMQSVEKVGG